MSSRAAGVGEFEARLASGANAPVYVRLTAGHLLIEGAGRATVHDVHVDDIVEVVRRGTRIDVARQRESPLALECERAEPLDAALIAACCTIPELTRALRSLGSSHVRAGGSAQREFFAPLLEARRRAEESVGRPGIVRAFDPDRLNRALDGYLAQLAARHSDPRPAARRAFAAQAEEAAEPLRAAIAEVGRTAPAAAGPPDDARVASWRRWSGALRALFAAADRCWEKLQPAAASERADGE
ncbi:MAG TPA: hypothetical protein VF737_01730 [Gemmatimonadaceae bacterium]